MYITSEKPLPVLCFLSTKKKTLFVFLVSMFCAPTHDAWETSGWRLTSFVATSCLSVGVLVLDVVLFRLYQVSEFLPTIAFSLPLIFASVSFLLEWTWVAAPRHLSQMNLV